MPRIISLRNINPDDLKESPLRLAWNKFLSLDKFTKLLIIPLVFIILALPLTVWVVGQTQNTQQKAAPVDQLEAEGGVLGGNAVVVSDSNASGGQSVRFTLSGPTPTVTPTMTPISTPTPTSTSRKIVNVSSVGALKTALADNTVDEIVVANGTYNVTTAGSQQANSLWIGSAYAGRTRPILVRAQTTGGVTFDGGGAGYFGGLTFNGGSHHQTWDGFRFANGEPTQTGVIVFGAYSGLAASHNITLRNITILGSVTSDNPAGKSGDHGIYFSNSIGGIHDILIDGFTVNGSGGLDSALHFYHSSPTERNAWNVTVRRMTVTGTDQAIIVWDATVQNIVIEDSTIINARDVAIRYEAGGTLTLRRVVSTGSPGGKGFYSALGDNPPQVMFDNSSLH